MTRRRRRIIEGLIVVGVALLSLTAAGRAAATGFFSSLRIAKPKPVSVTVPGFSGPTASRRLQDAIGGMIADTTSVTLDEADRPVASLLAADSIVGFHVLLPTTRRDSVTLIVVGAHSVAMTVDRAQLQTIMNEADNAAARVPSSLQGARVELRSPRAVRAQYGHCPAPVDNTLQGQIQGPPPPSTDNGDCVVLIESPPTSAVGPPGLDMQRLTGIALELAGMSPTQRQAFERMFRWQAALSMSMPRFMRSYDSVTVDGAPAMLLNTAGRRGPTYELLWTRDGTVFSLAGYGSSAEAVPLASSLSDTRSAK
jgi:hypothetical protein